MEEKYPWLKKAPFLLPVAWVIRMVSGLSHKESKQHMEKITETNDEKTASMLEIYHKMGLKYRR